MRVTDDILVLAATDLSNFLACPHRTALDLAAALGQLDPPEMRIDTMLRLLRERGEAHERAYLQHLRDQRLSVVEIPSEGSPAARVVWTLDALTSSADVIYQGAFSGDGWVGYADILRKVPCPIGVRSSLGDFHYEAYDTKLARETRGGTVLQLALYAELLGNAQGVAPERFFVVSPGDPFSVHEHRVTDYAAYFRMVRKRMIEALKRGPDALLAVSYPEPVEHCDVCPWWERCNAQRRQDDHLSFIAGAGRTQRTELVARGVTTLAAAAALTVPVRFTPSRGSAETYNRLAEQAKVQLEQRTTGKPAFTLLPITPGQGLCRLPEPSPDDLFLDLEGARFVREGGHDYLFGLGHVDTNGQFVYSRWWAMTPAEEQVAFEQLIDAILEARAANPVLHVYHFAPYEPTAMKRLAGRYATRQDALDDLLRTGCFVDLFAVVRQTIRAGVESYSIKELEQYYGYQRDALLREAGMARIAVELALEAREPGAVSTDVAAVVERYNRDDVESTRRLRDWLEKLRDEQLAVGAAVARPEVKEPNASQATERSAAAIGLRTKLLADVSPEASRPDHPMHARWLLAYLIDWHHREENAEWWGFFRLKELPEDDLLDEANAIAGLEHVAQVGPVLSKKGKPTGSVIHRYRYPPQELELSEGKRLQRLEGGTLGEIVALDKLECTVDVKRSKQSGDDHPSAAFSYDVVGTLDVQWSVMCLATRLHTEQYAQPCAGLDLLCRRPPRLLTGAFGTKEGETVPDCAVRLVSALDQTTLAIQGPPGAGKTYIGARMIRAAVAAAKRVGVTATSHKVIQNLFDEIRRQEEEEHATDRLRLGRKPGQEESPVPDVMFLGRAENAVQALVAQEIQVLGGTAWLWASEVAEGSVDILFVDEAGQFSLANALAVSPATGSLVLLGDPQQLDQPQKASHPDGIGVSALSHVLGEHETMPPDLGLFMPETWRLGPNVCAFTSELFYDSRLKPIPPLANQELRSGTYEGAGLWWIPVAHEGNRNAADEEVDAVGQLVEALLRAEWTDKDGITRPMTAADLRVVAPYNAQVNRLAARMAARGVQVGTVDKFQGQTCAAVIYSMATSSPQDAPRGMEFLYSLNRLNVATSRGRCAALIVASPGLLEPDCRTSRQMRLANGLCRFVEMANMRTQ